MTGDRRPAAPSRGGMSGGFVKDTMPSGPPVDDADLREAGLALCRRAILEAGLPYAPSRVRLSDLTVDQGDGLITALRALGVMESPEPEWHRDPYRHTVRRKKPDEDPAEA